MFMWQGVLKGKTSEEFWFWNVCVRGGICRNGKCNLTDPVRPDGCTYRFSQQGQGGGGAISIFFCRAKNWGKHTSSAMSHLLKPPPHYQAPHVNMMLVHCSHKPLCILVGVHVVRVWGMREQGAVGPGHTRTILMAQRLYPWPAQDKAVIWSLTGDNEIP